MVCLRTLLGLGHEGLDHQALRDLLECLNHVGTYRSKRLCFITRHVVLWILSCTVIKPSFMNIAHEVVHRKDYAVTPYCSNL